MYLIKWFTTHSRSCIPWPLLVNLPASSFNIHSLLCLLVHFRYFRISHTSKLTTGVKVLGFDVGGMVCSPQQKQFCSEYFVWFCRLWGIATALGMYDNIIVIMTALQNSPNSWYKPHSNCCIPFISLSLSDYISYMAKARVDLNIYS